MRDCSFEPQGEISKEMAAIPVPKVTVDMGKSSKDKRDVVCALLVCSQYIGNSF
jgi:hypothetical protein